MNFTEIIIINSSNIRMVDSEAIVIEKSDGDLNEYLEFKLPNGLQVLLIQDNN